MNSEVQVHQSSKPQVTLSDSALVQVEKYLAKNTDALGMRLGVKETGCSGLSYVVEYAKHHREDDVVIQYQDINIYIDHKSLPYLNGTHMDYVKQGLNEKFVFNNPNEKGSCGCGESFTV